MRIFVTAGNTLVLIDKVRAITNIFTGRTGAGIALEAHRRGHHVTLATSHPEVAPPPERDRERWHCVPYRTFDDLHALMEEHVGNADAVVHCAAVSDYTTAGVYAPAPGCAFDSATGQWQGKPALLDRAAGKVKSGEPELWLRLVRTPKLVDKIRTTWKFSGILVKFKLEVGLSDTELLQRAETARQHSAADWMVANTLEDAEAWAYLGNAASYKKVTRAELPGALLDVIEREGEAPAEPSAPETLPHDKHLAGSGSAGAAPSQDAGKPPNDTGSTHG